MEKKHTPLHKIPRKVGRVRLVPSRGGGFNLEERLPYTKEECGSGNVG